MQLATIISIAFAVNGPPAQSLDSSRAEVPPPSGDLVQLGGFTIDMSDVRQRPVAELPQDPLLPSDLAIGSLVQRLLQTQEGFQLVETTAGRQFLESASWYLERDPAEGIVFALRRERDDVVPEAQDEIALKIAARQRLGELGIHGGEIARTLQRRLIRQDESDGQVAPARVHRYKTFALRGINGVEVEGHRAVITHHLDGSFHRAWIKWPALAADGHRLQTDLDDETLAMLAFIALHEAGEVDGDVKLRFKYVPTLLPGGTIELELMLAARLAPVEHDEYTEEAREINVAIDAH